MRHDKRGTSGFTAVPDFERLPFIRGCGEFDFSIEHVRVLVALNWNQRFGRPLYNLRGTVEEWGEIFGDEVMATALIDRLVHHCHW